MIRPPRPLDMDWLIFYSVPQKSILPVLVLACLLVEECESSQHKNEFYPMISLLADAFLSQYATKLAQAPAFYLELSTRKQYNPHRRQVLSVDVN